MQNILEMLARIGPGRLIAIGVTVLGLLGFLGFFVDKMTKPEMAVLFADLEPADAGTVMTRLETMGVVVETDQAGTAIMAPKGEIARLRMILAQDGLPSGGGGGYELLDNANGLGATSFAQQMTRLRALEGELARSIRTLGPVRQARVHLVLPKRELFSREQQEPTASIVVAVRGAALTAGQVAAIRHMVAAAVPKLQPSRVSIVDTSGNLLASGEEANGKNGAQSLGLAAQERKIDIQRRLAEAIERLLERAVGPGRVRAEVSADLDFDRITTNSEEFDPAGQVLRSNQIITQEEEAAERAGDDRVSVDRNLPDADLAGENAAGSNSKKNRTEEISNFEISKTIRTHIRESGLVRRLSVAVMVDAEATQDADGKTVFQPRSAEQLATLEQLAKSAVGFDAARGDVFDIASLEFVRPEAIFGDENPDDIVLTKEDYFRIGQLAALFVVALLAVLLVMRPAVTRMFAKAEPEDAQEDQAALIGPDGQPVAALTGPDGEALPIGEAGEESDRIQLDAIRGSVSLSTMTKVGSLIDEFPEESLSVVRSWMQGD